MNLEDELQAIRARYRAERAQYPEQVIDLARVVAELSATFAYAASVASGGVSKELVNRFSHCTVTLTSLAVLAIKREPGVDIAQAVEQVSKCVSSFTNQAEEQATARKKARQK